MFCEKCGEKRENNDRFCAHCGTSFTSNDKIVTKRPEPVQQSDPKVTQYNKIEGWLYLVGFGLFITPFILGYGVLDSLSIVSDSSMTEMNELVPGLTNALWFEIIMDSALFFAVVYLAFLFYGKRKIFTKHYVWYLAISITYLIIDYALFASLTTGSSEMREVLDGVLEEEIASMFGSIVASVLWIAYMKKSKRVAGTFKN